MVMQEGCVGCKVLRSEFDEYQELSTYVIDNLKIKIATQNLKIVELLDCKSQLETYKIGTCAFMLAWTAWYTYKSWQRGSWV